MEPPLLSDELRLPREIERRLAAHYEKGILKDLSVRIEDVLATDYNLDIRARYGPIEIAHPIGKASGQLSLQAKQVAADAEAGVAFVVLKTVIAEDERGGASMEAWKIREPRMEVERIRGKRVAREGWTVSWAGRGWEGSLATYCEFMGQALRIGAAAEMPVIPSCKFNLPSSADEPFLAGEYETTSRRLEEVWKRAHPNRPPDRPMVLEKDFSPTLAGTDAASSKRLILKWLRESPAMIKAAAPDCILGVKLMNALFEDEFQLEMMAAVCREGTPADFIVCFNRLFDPERSFGKKKGIAIGGPDLSDRNLTILRRAMEPGVLEKPLPISATGDITSGRIMIEYALRGAMSGQVHTFFQIPTTHFQLKGASRSRAALHELYFHPREGIVAAMCHLREETGGGSGTLAFLDLPKLGRERLLAQATGKSAAR